MNQKKITIVAKFQARPEKESDLRTALIALIERTRKEIGCLNYDLHQSQDDPAIFLFHENWATQEDFERHLSASHIQAFLPGVEELCLHLPEITCWKQIA